MEILNVFADEMVNFGLLVLPPVGEIFAMSIAPLSCGGHVADGGVEPDVPVVAGAVGNFETEIRRGSRNIPIAERLVQEMPLQVIGHLRLQMIASLGPFVQKFVQLPQLDKQVRRLANLGRGPGNLADRIDQFRGTVMMAADTAVVAGLVGGVTFGTSAPHKAIGQKGFGLRIVQLFDIFFLDQSRFPDRRPKLLAQLAIFLTVRAAVVIELDIKTRKVPLVLGMHPLDILLLANPLLLGTDHDRRAVRIVGTDVNTAMTTQLLKPDPDIGLHVFDQMPDMNRPVGVRQSGGDKNLALGHWAQSQDSFAAPSFRLWRQQPGHQQLA